MSSMIKTKEKICYMQNIPYRLKHHLLERQIHLQWSGDHKQICRVPALR